MQLQKPWYVGWSRTRAWLWHGFLVLLAYLGAAIPLTVALAILLGRPQPEPEVLAILGALLLLSPLAIRLSRRGAPRLDEIEDYHHRGRLADELIPSRFSIRKLAWLTGAGLIFGGLLGLWFGVLQRIDTLWWPAIGAGALAAAGTLLALEGEGVGGPAGGGHFARRPLYWIVRSVALMLTGGLVGLMSSSLNAGGGVHLLPGIAGALFGLLMSSESHRWLSQRLQWLLQQARLGAWAILGAYLGLSMVSLLRTPWPWSISGYGHLSFAFIGLSPLLWRLFYFVITLMGAAAGLRAADGAGYLPAKATRLFMGLLGIQLVIGLPVYVIFNLLTASLRTTSLFVWINFWAAILAAAAVAWALRFRGAEVQAAVRKARSLLDAAKGRLATAVPGVVRRAWYMLFPSSPVLPAGHKGLKFLRQVRLPSLAAAGRWRQAMASLTLNELSNEMTLSLAIAATGVAVLVQPLIATLVVSLFVGIGTILVYTLLVIVAIVGLVLVLRYFRNR